MYREIQIFNLSETDQTPGVRFWQRNRYEPVARCNGAMRDGDWKLVWPMREGADWKDPQDNVVFRAGLTAAHRIMPVHSPLPRREIAPAGDARLFNLDVDPHEDRDLSAEQPDRVARMTDAWDAWFAEVTGQWQRTFEGNTDSAD